MSRLLRRVQFDIVNRDGSDNITNITGVSGYDVTVYRAGAPWKSGGPFGAGAGTVTVYQPGRLKVGDVFYFTISGTLTTTNSYTISTITYNSTDNDWDIAFSGNTATSLQPVTGDRLVLRDLGSNNEEVTLYKEETGQLAESNPVNPGSTHGMVKFYCDEAAVDIKLSGTGIDDRWMLDTQTEGVRDAINVKDFGAEGDGSTDDTTAIQQALDYAGDLLGGCDVFFPEGDWRLTADTSVWSNTRIMGCGYNSRIFADTTNVDIFEAATNSASRVHITDVFIDGDANTGCTVNGANGSDWVVTRTVFEDLTFTGDDDFQFSNNQIVSGRYVTAGDREIITDNYIDANSNHTHALTVSSGNSNCFVNGNILRGGTTADFVDSGTDTTVGINDTSDTSAKVSGFTMAGELIVASLEGTTENLAAAASNSINDTTTVLNLTSASAFIDSFSTSDNGRILYVRNASSSNIITLRHESSAVANEFKLPREQNLRLRPREGCTMIGITTSGQDMWQIQSHPHSVKTYAVADITTPLGTTGTTAGSPVEAHSMTFSGGDLVAQSGRGIEIVCFGNIVNAGAGAKTITLNFGSDTDVIGATTFPAGAWFARWEILCGVEMVCNRFASFDSGNTISQSSQVFTQALGSDFTISIDVDINANNDEVELYSFSIREIF